MRQMAAPAQWLFELDTSTSSALVDGLIPVRGYDRAGRDPAEVSVMERAAAFGADAVFFEASREGSSPRPPVFIFVSSGPPDDPSFRELHRRLWSWGGVPLVCRKFPGLLQLFRCAHKPYFVSSTRSTVCNPFKVLN